MNAPINVLLSTFLAIAAGSAIAADNMTPGAAAMKKEMTMRECADHMAIAKADGAKKDDARMKTDATCADMMKKGDAAKPAVAASAAMKK